jgi:aspartate/methionine/tyrosine aminotransferase
MNIQKKFQLLGVDHAPGQECRQQEEDLPIKGGLIPGKPVDFSHGDVDAFTPVPGAQEAFNAAVEEGAAQAYTEYRGRRIICDELAEKLSDFTGAKIDGGENIILTTGTQGALFLAMGANVSPGDKVAFVEPDYFANRKMILFFGGELSPVRMNWMEAEGCAGLDFDELEQSFKDGARVFVFSNPNNPTGVIYSESEIEKIAKLAEKYNVTVIADELYSRQIFDGRGYTHLCAQDGAPENLITILGPSKTESLSGYRLGVAFGTPSIIARMEKLQAIMCLRCAGYNQSVFKVWFSEPDGWMKERIAAHQRIRDEILTVLKDARGFEARPTEGGSYLFVKLPQMDVPLHTFVKILRKQANVSVTPGTEFGPQFTDWFRINFSQDRVSAVDAVKRIVKTADLYRK